MLLIVVQVTCLSLISWYLYNVIYSIMFSPLRHIPSSWVMQLCPIYFYILVARGDAPFYIYKYHCDYGPVIRVGWNRVLFVDEAAAQIIYGSHELTKTSNYDGFNYFGESIFSTKSRLFHQQRRKLVGPAFTRRAVADMEFVIRTTGIVPLLNNIEKAVQLNKPIDMYIEFSGLAWDIIGYIGFGQTFNILSSGQIHPIKNLIALSGALSMANMLAPFMFYLQLALKKLKLGPIEQLRVLSHKILIKSLENKYALEAKNTILSHYVSGQLEFNDLVAETNVLLLAGTETVSSALTWLHYFVAKHPEVEEKLRNELTLYSLETMTYQECQLKLPYLQACIKETMRLLPPAPNMPLRDVPKSGINIMGYYLPNKTQVGVPIYSLHRSPFLWEQYDTFLPERWVDKLSGQCLPSLPHYIPFLLGPRACIGKDLAWLELLLVSAHTFQRYQFRLVDKSHQMICLPALRPISGQLNMVVTKRVKTNPTLE